ncbi:MAG TPA: GMC family oxidoreductase N-terminal domain-containing protein [Marmoricola sp.]|nr:GMC family oxidoreductase N-terminal domain-containing protein [Marmoricola sp.]
MVVGSGSAGAVVASRLSEDPAVSVLLVEAGGSSRNMNVQIPAAFAKQFKGKLDWDYETEPEPYLDNRRIYHPRGKMLGGCSGNNAMIYIRGNRADYDSWADGGAKGWSYDEVLPYFKKMENNSRGADAFHGAGGPMHIQDLRTPTPLTGHLIDAAVTVGIPRTNDFNGAEQLGVGYNQVNHKDGRRWTTWDAYLAPAKKRANLTIWSGTQARKVMLEGNRAVGLEVQRQGIVQTVRASREVVLSAGAFGTPHLLMLSGIGPAEHLREHGINVVIDNANVGSHMMDHPMYLVNNETSMKGTLAEAESPKQLIKYLTQKRGMLSSNVGEASAFFHTRSGDAAPYMQFIFAPGFFWNHGFDTHPTPAFGIGCSMVGAQSTGEVRLKNADPLSKPSVLFNYFSAPEDMDAMVAGIERAREVIAQASREAGVGKELHPGGQVQTRTELEAEIRRSVEHTYHPSCTARMGSEADGVIDSALRVHGISGLRVADASAFPTITHGNTHTPTVMVGEKAADLIKEAR